MRPAELLNLLRKQGVQLVLVGDELRYRPASAVTPEWRARLMTHKAEIVRLLSYEAAVTEYEYLGAQIDVLTEETLAARERGDEESATRLNAAARELVQGPYWRAGKRMAELADDLKTAQTSPRPPPTTNLAAHSPSARGIPTG